MIYPYTQARENLATVLEEAKLEAVLQRPPPRTSSTPSGIRATKIRPPPNQAGPCRAPYPLGC